MSGEKLGKLEESLDKGGLGEVMAGLKGSREMLQGDIFKSFQTEVFDKMKVDGLELKADSFVDGKLKDGVLDGVKGALEGSLNNVNWKKLAKSLNMDEVYDFATFKEWLVLRTMSTLKTQIEKSVEGQSVVAVKVVPGELLSFDVVVEGSKVAVDTVGSVKDLETVDAPEDEGLVKLKEELDASSEESIVAMVGKMGPLGWMFARMLKAKDDNGDTLLSKLFRDPDKHPMLAAGLGAIGVPRFKKHWGQAMKGVEGNKTMQQIAGQVGGTLQTMGSKIPEHLKVNRRFSKDLMKRALEGNYWNKVNDEPFVVVGEEGKGVEVSGQKFMIAWPGDGEVVFAKGVEGFASELKDGVRVATVESIPADTVFPAGTNISLVSA